MSSENNQREEVKEETTFKKKLGISKDIDAKSSIPISAPAKLPNRTSQYPNGYLFPIANLVKVSFDPEKVVKRNGFEDKVPSLLFLFKTKDGKQYSHNEFPLDDTDTKWDMKYEALQRRIKHVFEETVGSSKFEEFSATDFSEFFKKTAELFNKHTVTKDEKVIPVYYTTPVYVKLTYYQTRAQFGLYPNLIQRAQNGDVVLPCELIVNPSVDQIEPIAKPKASLPLSDSSAFSNSSSFDEDFPDIN